MQKKWLCFALAGVLALSVGALAACGDKENGKEEEGGLKAVVLPSYDNDRTKTGVAVHDPSVFRDPVSKKYYAFGSHFAVASSDDLIIWEQEVNDGEWQKLYGEVGSGSTGWWNALPKAHAAAGGQMSSTWAPDVEYHDGKYYMYVSVTNSFGSSQSAISRVSSDNVLGPYADEELIVTSDASKSVNNAIDPELFYDKNGGLWMVYGSTYGGINIIELENSGEKWGLPKEDQGVGKNIWKAGNNVEGPFIFYNDTTDYYYLMTSYGDLNTSYNMRLARSKNPDGPYEDATGTAMTDISGSGGTGGNKVAGNYKFARQGNDMGYAALGHNSVVKDDTGRYFVVYHTRRITMSNNNVTGYHNLYVSQLFFNEDGWPVMNPNAYVGEKLGIVTEAQVAKDYEVVIHADGITAVGVNSEDYGLEMDGTVTKGGENVGTWELKESYYITITLGEEVYKGVVAPGWDMYNINQDEAEGILSITAVSNKGRSLWAIAKY